MGLRKSDKGKKSEGLAILLRRDEGEEGGHRAAGVSNYNKGDELNNALRYVLDVESSEQELCCDGDISFAAVREVLDERVSTLASETSEEPSWEDATVGRLGPRVVSVDQTSVFGRLGLSPDGLRLESQGNFSSCRANSCVFAGKWMYEATLGTAGIQQIGWATLGCQFTNEEGVGDASHSYAFDGKRVRKWCVEPEGYGQPWAPGDVIGCCMDLDAGELSFYRNSVSMGVAYPNVSTLQTGLGYFPAISLSHGERCDLNFGGHPFQYPVEGFQPLQLAPPASEIRKSRYLEGCFRRLIEVTGCQSSRHVAPNVMLSKPGLPVDDRVLLAAAIVSPLRVLLDSNYHIVDFFIPFLREIAGQSDTSIGNLMLCLNMLECALGKEEFDRVMTTVVESLSRACGSSTFKPADLPETASYPHLMLMNSLLKCSSVRALFLGLPNINKLIEGFLTRKQPTAEDLKNLLPTVWYKGCKDDNSSEERMSSIVTALSSALQKVEQCQFDLLKLLLEEDKASGSKHVLHFFKHLLKANQGASRNVQPPGLSDVSVLVSSFNLLLRLLRPSLMLQSDGHSCLEDFPARELFVDGAVSQERSLHHDLPRLGGLLSYLQKEHPLMVAASIPVHVQLEQDVGVVEGGSPLAQPHLVPHGMVGKLLHILILLYRLGIEAALKMTLHQFQTEAGQRAQLSKLEQRLANPEKNGSSHRKKLADDVQKQREEVVKSVRHCTWYKVVLFMPWKQECMFLLTVYLAKMLSLLSETSSDLFRYVPEAYVEAMLDLFQAVAKLDPRFANLDHLQLLGLQPLISFLVQHFSHPMLVNPQICDALLQGMAALFADKQLLYACQCNEHALKTLVPDLLKAFDSRHWLSIAHVFLHIAKETGFDQSRDPSSGGSPVFLELLVKTCQEKPHLLDNFLNRLFNTLNWTVTEMTVTLGEIDEHLQRLDMMGGNYSNPDVVRLYRKSSVLFGLSLSLLRLLELVTWQMPFVFLSGSKLNLTRVVEVIGFVLSHVTVGSDARIFDKVLNAPQSWQEWKSKVSRPTILAPMAGILTNLHKAEKMRSRKHHPQQDHHQGGDRRGRDFGGALWGSVGLVSSAVSGAVVGVQRLVMGGSERRAMDSRDTNSEPTHTIAAALAESLSAPPECLTYFNKVEWNLPSGSSGLTSSSQAEPSTSILELREVLEAYQIEVDRRSRSTSLDLDCAESIPEDFLDPIVMTVMEDPVILPDSKITVDRSTIERHLLTQQTDPFSRAELSKDMVIPNRELRSRVEQWKSNKLKQSES